MSDYIFNLTVNVFRFVTRSYLLIILWSRTVRATYHRYESPQNSLAVAVIPPPWSPSVFPSVIRRHHTGPTRTQAAAERRCK